MTCKLKKLFYLNIYTRAIVTTKTCHFQPILYVFLCNKQAETLLNYFLTLYNTYLYAKLRVLITHLLLVLEVCYVNQPIGNHGHGIF